MNYKYFKFRIYPTKEQENQLSCALGSARFIWNYCLNENNKTYDSIGSGLSKWEMKRLIPNLKSIYPWLTDTSSNALQNKIMDLGTSFDRFFKGTSKKPKFKSRKTDKTGIRIDQISNHIKFDLNNSVVKLPKMTWMKCTFHRPLEGKFKSLTIKRDIDQWYIVCLCEINEVKSTPTSVCSHKILGIDLGLTDFYTDNLGNKIPNPKFTNKKQKKLKRQQRKISRRQKSSKNREKARILFAKSHRKIRNQRNDFINKQVSHLKNNFDIICCETLDIKKMMKNKSFSKSIGEVSWGSFISKLDERTQLIKIDQFKPSTKTCSCCGHIQPMKISDRMYDCQSCGFSCDRDINAAINIRNWGMEEINRVGTTRINACGDITDLEVGIHTTNHVSKKQETSF